MICILSNDIDKQKFKTYVEYLLNKGCIVEIKEKKAQRTMAQNRYLHLLLGLFASETGYDLDSVKHEIFKKMCNKELFVRERNGIEYVRSTRDLDTGEMTTAIERFRNFASQEGGIYLPEPDEYDALLEAEKQIALIEKYL